MAALSDEIKAIAEFSPVEDVLLPILRDGLPEMKVQSLIELHQEFPCVYVRRLPNFGQAGGDPRFVDAARISVHSFCQDPNGDEEAALLGEACRVVLRDAWQNQTVIAGRGHISRFEMNSAPRRAPDWASSVGPVQYADLPTGVHRYEALYDIEIRRYSTHPFPLP